MNKRLAEKALLVLLTLGVGLWPAIATAHEGPEGEQHSEEAEKATPGKAPKGGEIAVIEVEKFGTVKIRFYDDVAPKTVENFKKLARQGFYDGTAFHRVVPGFMIQGGDPNTKSGNPDTWGMGGPGYGIKAEFNDKPHKRGVASMARSANPDSAGSQFFICLADASFLNRQYTAFGEVIEGMDVVDKIAHTPTMGDPRNESSDRTASRPKEKVILKKVSIQEKK